MPISDIVNVAITATSAAPTIPGFGEPLIAAYTTIGTGRVVEYGSLSEMVSAGFLVTDAAYKCASKVWSNNPAVPKLKVGKRALAFTQTVQLAVIDHTQNDVFGFSVGGKPVTYTVPGGATNNSVAAALTTAITALAISGLTCTNPSSPSPNILLTMTPGLMIDVLFDTTKMTVTDTTADPGVATDLAAITVIDGNWYGLLLDSQSPAEISAAATWAEANGPRLFMANCSDSAIADPASTTDVAYTLKQSAFARTGLLFSQTQLQSYSAAAWMGNRFPSTPGSDTWAFKTLAGVPADNLTTAQVHAVEAKNANVYTPVGGLNITQFGTSAGGTFIDITRFIDWLTVNLQYQVFGLLANNQKIPFTDAGIDMVRSTIAGVLQQGIDNGGLAANPAPVIVMPTAAQVDATNKAKRNLPNVNFSAKLAGAIHSLTINGTVSV